MHAAGAAGAVIALGDCSSPSSAPLPAYGGVHCVPPDCAPVVQDAGPDASEAGVTDGAASDAAEDAPDDAPDGG
jgi:hypothetical protein